MRKFNHVLKSKIGVLSLLLSLTFVVGCSKDEEGMGIKLGGIISESQTGKRLAGAKVKLEPVGKECITGFTGTYEFNDLSSGNYAIVVSKENYHTQREDVNIDLLDGDAYTRDITLISSQVSDISVSVSPLSLDFGYDESTASLDIVNTGDFPINWEISSLSFIGTTELTMTIPGDSILQMLTCFPTSGQIEVNEIQTVTLNIDRNLFYSGEHALMIHFTFDGGKSVDVNVKFSIPSYSGEVPNTSEKMRTFVINKATPYEETFNMILVPKGTFTMGSTPEEAERDNEKPAHDVTLTTDYYIGETEVTQKLWREVMGYNPSHDIGLQKPVEMVSWEDCQTFITKLKELTGQTFRLPTEAEWEFAARGGNRSKGYLYSGSNTLDDVAWYFDNSDGSTHAVKTKAPNELGIYDRVAMYSNGVRIGMEAIAVIRKPTQPVLLPALTAFFVVAVGTTMLRTAAWLDGSTLRHRTWATSSVFALLFPVLAKK